MVVVKMAENHILHVAEIELQFARVFEDGVGASAGVEKYLVTISFDEGGESPFADAFVRQHGGENCDLQGMNPSGSAG